MADNSARVFEVYWAALRCGLMLTAVNHHLTAAEVAYIVRDCGAKALVVAGTLGPLAEAVGEEVPEVGLRLAYGGPVEGFADYDAALDGVADTPLADEPAGAVMLYSSGTTGRPEGRAAAAAGAAASTSPGSRRAARAGALRLHAGTVYLSPAPLYHAAPLRFSTHGPGARRHGRGDGAVRRRGRAGGDRALPRHAQPVGADDVRADAQAPARGARALRRVVDAGGDPRRGAVPGRRQAGDDRLVGPGHPRVLRRPPRASASRSSTPAQWLAHPGSVGARGSARCTSSTRTTGELLPGGRGHDLLRTRRRPVRATTTTPRRRAASRHPEHGDWGTIGDIGYLDDDG